MIERVTVVGAGLVGQGWAIAFARAGVPVTVHDVTDLDRIRENIARSVQGLAAEGLCEDPQGLLGRLSFEVDLGKAVRDADYIQESVFERIETKRAISLEIDRAMRPDAIVGSSTSGFPGSSFTAECSHRNRFLVVHPVNPPHLIPLVEIVPAPWTDEDIPQTVRRFMEAIGQSPINLSREIDGFVLNRLQGALLDEAFALLGEGYATAEDIDKAVRDGLGFRWAFMGPFETIDLNAPEGLKDYAERLAPMYARFAEQRKPDRRWTAEAIETAHRQRRELLASESLRTRQEWRDRMLTRMKAFKSQNKL